MADFWAGDRATAPPIVELISSETRAISIGLGSAIAPGEIISPTGQTARLTRWRDGVSGNVLALSGSLTYDTVGKVVTQRIDASKLPVREPMALTISFQVTGSAGVDTRAVFVALYVVV